MNALKAGCDVCRFMANYLGKIEFYFFKELIETDLKKNTYNDYLRTFLDPSWIDRQSFCVAGQAEVRLRETLTTFTGPCYTLNFDDGIFDPEM